MGSLQATKSHKIYLNSGQSPTTTDLSWELNEGSVWIGTLNNQAKKMKRARSLEPRFSLLFKGEGQRAFLYRFSS